MNYKTIVVHVDASDGAAARIAFAAALARDAGAHLIGMTQTGIYRFVAQTAVPGVDLSGLTPLFGQLREDAERRALAFDEAVRGAGVASSECRIGDEEPETALALQALYADLVVVGRAHGDEQAHPNDAALPQYVAMNAPCPVLVLPQAGTPPRGVERVLVAWNASPEASRAVRMALPFLVRARAVDVAVFDADDHGQSGAPAADAGIGQFLARHGVHATVRHHPAQGDAGAALLALAGTWKADLLVMGCYGHSRLREIVLGGVSRTVLHRAALPVLLAH